MSNPFCSITLSIFLSISCTHSACSLIHIVLSPTILCILIPSHTAPANAGCYAGQLIAFLVIAADSLKEMLFLCIHLQEPFSSYVKFLYNNLSSTIISFALRISVFIAFGLRVAGADDNSQRGALAMSLCMYGGYIGVLCISDCFSH